MWMFKYFLGKKTKVALSSRLKTKVDRRRSKDGKLTSYRDVVNYHLRKYVAEEVILAADEVINQFRRGERLSPAEYTQEIWSEEYKRRTVYDEAHLQRRSPRVNFTEGSQLLGKEPRNISSRLGATAKFMKNLRGDSTTFGSSDKTSRGGSRGGNSLVIENDGGFSSTSRRNAPSIISEERSSPLMQEAI